MQVSMRVWKMNDTYSVFNTTIRSIMRHYYYPCFY